MKILEISHLSKRFGDLEVLKDISVTINKGEIVSIIGPSGSGKSTFLRCATLLERMEHGTMKYQDEVVCEEKDSHGAVYAPTKTLRKLRSLFGLVFQNFNLFPHWSVLKNITDAPISVQGRPKDEVLADARQLL